MRLPAAASLITLANAASEVAILFDYDADAAWAVQPHGQGLSYSVELDAIQDSLPLREVMSSARLLQELQATA